MRQPGQHALALPRRARRAPCNRPVPIGVAAGLFLAVLLTTERGAAQDTALAVRCARLDEDAAAELRARVRLTLAAAVAPPAGIVVECDALSATLVWQGPPEERLPVVEQAGLVEGVIAAIEQRLDVVVPAPRVPDAPPAPLPSPRGIEAGESLALEREPEPPPEPPARTRERRPERLAGGLLVGADLEPRSDSAAYGPHLELGAGARGVAVLALQSFRVDPTLATNLFDTRLGVGWGAPFAGERWLGATVFVGVQGLSGVGRRVTAPGRSADSTAILGLGLRTGIGGETLAFVGGADLVWRARTLSLDAPYDVRLPGWHVGLTGALAFLARRAKSAR